VGDLVLLSTTNLVDLRKKTACSRLSSRFVGPFRVLETPVDESAPKQGRPENYVWLGLPASLGQIRQPFNLARLKRFVERPEVLGASTRIKEPLLLSPLWGRHVGDNIDSISAFHLAEFCVGHDLTFHLPADYYPPDHAEFPFNGPRGAGLRHQGRRLSFDPGCIPAGLASRQFPGQD